ncbi:MAG: hypothetical protein V4515_14975 [Chloroflexota bacterium]
MIREIPGHGLMLDGHSETPTHARDTAAAYLVEKGADAWDADTSSARVARAWWGGDEVGFVQAEFDGAQPVTVVHVHVPEG